MNIWGRTRFDSDIFRADQLAAAVVLVCHRFWCHTDYLPLVLACISHTTYCNGLRMSCLSIACPGIEPQGQRR